MSPAHRTPSNAIWTLAAVALFLGFSVKLYSAVVSIAVIALYVSYGLPIAAGLYARGKGTWHTKGPWNLGKLSTLVTLAAMLWIMFIICVFVLPPNDQAGLVMGACMALLLASWFIRVRSTFKGPRVQLQHYEEPTPQLGGAALRHPVS